MILSLDNLGLYPFLLSSIETLIETIYDKPKTRFNKHSETFHVKLDIEKTRALQELTSKREITNISNAFGMCIDIGLSEFTIKKTSNISLRANKEKWPNIYEAWIKGKFGNNLITPYITAMDLLENELKNKS